MADAFTDLLEASRNKLLRAIGDSAEITFLRPPGNIGDHLIHAGTRQLLAGVPYSEVSILQSENVTGDTAVVGGGGGWCGPFHDMPLFLPAIEERFERVIVFPSSFDVRVESVKRWLLKTKALVFAREEISFQQINDLCNAEIALDCAFFFNFDTYKRLNGRGTLTAFRTDGEAGSGAIPPDNNDISQTCDSLDEWLWTIARCAAVRTDRAHVTIAAAMLGKRVDYRASNYHKVPAIVEYSLPGFPVHRIAEETTSQPHMSAAIHHQAVRASTKADSHLKWTEAQRLVMQELADLIPEQSTFLFVDEEQIGSLPIPGRLRLPFLERHGQYWGPPEDDDQAIQELTRLRQSGAGFMVFAWPAFWWLDHYAGLHEHLNRDFRCALRNDRLIAFDLRK